MSTSTVASPERVAFANGTLSSHQDRERRSVFERNGKSILSLSNVAVFRAGTFRDSMGFQRTWDDFQLEGMVRNFDHLRSQGVFQDVPVRAGHPSFGTNPIDNIIGYVTGMRVEKRTASIENKEHLFLVADFEILDPAAQEKINSGLWRNRSAEIGTYVDNEEREYAPTFMGVAYVDIPAVERLNEFAKNHQSENFRIMTEAAVSGTEPIITPPAPSGAPAPVVTHGAPAPALATFSLGGNTTSDYAAVQAYITGLETANANYAQAETERELSDRDAFVTSLVDGNKLTAPNQAATTAFARSLTAEQFSAWKATQEGAPVLPLLAEHGATGTTPPAAGGEQSPVDAAFETAKGVVRQMSIAKVPVEQIKASPSYAKCLASDPQFQIPTR